MLGIEINREKFFTDKNLKRKLIQLCDHADCYVGGVTDPECVRLVFKLEHKTDFELTKEHLKKKEIPFSVVDF